LLLAAPKTTACALIARGMFERLTQIGEARSPNCVSSSNRRGPGRQPGFVEGPDVEARAAPPQDGEVYAGPDGRNGRNGGRSAAGDQAQRHA
jgi:hypothetical protein